MISKDSQRCGINRGVSLNLT